MAKFCSLYSSSSGNSSFIGSSAGGVLIDAGVSAKKITEALSGIDTDISAVAGIFVTHEHSDHINGVRVLASKYHIKVYATQGTLEGMERAGVFKSAVDAYIIPPEGMEIGGMYVRPFPISHDCAEPTGYTVITTDSKRISVVTDTGRITDEIEQAVMGSDLVLLESNHDVGMLQNGPYPFVLKQRILSDVGHLSNEAGAEFAAKLVKSGTTRLVLGHLSKENNIPSLAYETSKYALSQEGLEVDRDYLLTVAGDLNAPVVF